MISEQWSQYGLRFRSVRKIVRGLVLVLEEHAGPVSLDRPVDHELSQTSRFQPLFRDRYQMGSEDLREVISAGVVEPDSDQLLVNVESSGKSAQRSVRPAEVNKTRSDQFRKWLVAR